MADKIVEKPEHEPEPDADELLRPQGYRFTTKNNTVVDIMADESVSWSKAGHENKGRKVISVRGIPTSDKTVEESFCPPYEGDYTADGAFAKASKDFYGTLHMRMKEHGTKRPEYGQRLAVLMVGQGRKREYMYTSVVTLIKPLYTLD